MMEAKQKRVRKPNYSSSEITTLLEQIAANKQVIQSSLNNDITNQKKNAVWAQIADDVSRCGVCLRTAEHVREKFSDIKKDFFARQKRSKDTGGGPHIADKFYDDLLMHIIGRESSLLHGVDGGFDTFSANTPIGSASCSSTSNGSVKDSSYVQHNSDMRDVPACVNVPCATYSAFYKHDMEVPLICSTPRPKSLVQKEVTTTVLDATFHDQTLDSNIVVFVGDESSAAGEGGEAPVSEMTQAGQSRTAVSPGLHRQLKSAKCPKRLKSCRKRVHADIANNDIDMLYAEYLKGEIEKTRVKTRVLLLKEMMLKRDLGLEQNHGQMPV